MLAKILAMFKGPVSVEVKSTLKERIAKAEQAFLDGQEAIWREAEEKEAELLADIAQKVLAGTL